MAITTNSKTKPPEDEILDPSLPARPRTPQSASRWKRLWAYRKDMFLAMPTKLYRAKMAEVRTPFFKSFLVNEPSLQSYILESPADQFPKSPAIYGSLEALLSQGIFVVNGEQWAFQRRIIDPAFKGGRIKLAYPSMQDAAQNFVKRLRKSNLAQPIEMEFECSFFAADVIFRTMFSKPIEHHLAKSIFNNFQNYQRAQPVFNFPNILRLPAWVPRFYSRQGQKSAKAIQAAIAELIDERLNAIKNGSAPDDLVTNILTRKDKITGQSLSRDEAIGNIAVFFIAGHETSASALAWALYLLALRPNEQNKVLGEVQNLDFSALSYQGLQNLEFTKSVIFETLRLYPPVPMLVREAASEEEFRNRKVSPQDWCITSPWYSGRHQEIWDDPDDFQPERWRHLPEHCRAAYFPFSKGPRICTGAGFAQTELLLALSLLVQNFEFSLTDTPPIPVAHLTVRALDGISLHLRPRL